MNTIRYISATALSLALACAMPALAQIDSSGAAIASEGNPIIIVTGELQDRTIQDTQSSVSVVTGEELDRSVDKDLFDVIDRIPGVNQTGGGFTFVVRGISTNGVGGGSAPTVNVQVDGAVVPSAAVRTGPFSTWDVAQVEVLRGPQSTQQGPSSLAGAIILETQDPQFNDFELKLRGDYASFDEARAAAAVNVPLSDILAARFTLEDFRSDGDIENRFTGEDAAREYLRTYRGKIRLRPHDDFDAILSYSRSENRQGDQGVNEDSFPDQRLTDATSTVIGNIDTITLEIDAIANDNWSIGSETTYLVSDYELDIPFVAANPAALPGNRTIAETSLSSEFKVIYDTENLRGVVGAYYLRLEQDLDFVATIADISVVFPLPPGLPTISATLANANDSDSENFALFGEVEFDVSENLTLVAGARWDNESEQSVATQQSVFTPDLLGLSATGEPVSLESDFSAFLPKAAIIYNFNPDVSLSFTAQRAYRAGGSATTLLGVPYSFDPEFSNNFELALRSIFAGGRATINANLFYTDYTDMQVSVPGPSGTFFDTEIQNAGAATLWGFEIESEYRFSRNFSVYANIGYSNTRFDEYVIVENNQPIDLEGNRFPEAPEWTGSIGAEMALDNGVFADFSINHTDSSFYTSRNLPGELNRAFTLVNARVGYESEDNWSVALFARNLLDEQYLARRRVDTSDSAGDSQVIGVSVFASF